VADQDDHVGRPGEVATTIAARTSATGRLRSHDRHVPLGSVPALARYLASTT